MNQNAATVPIRYAGSGSAQAWPGDLEAPHRPAQAQDRRDEHQLPDLDTEIEEQQRERDLAGGQPDLGQRAGEAQSMEQAEGEGDQPGERDG